MQLRQGGSCTDRFQTTFCWRTGRAQLFVESPGGGEWGFYDTKRLPVLVDWLESGSDAEQDLADVIHEAFELAAHSTQVPLMHSRASGLQSISGV